MTAGVDLSQFFDTFFDEADELLADIEHLLLALDVDNPDIDALNGIFRAAHSIKGGAGTFGCFELLAETTHLLENLLDCLRRREMPLRKDMIDLFLETKDVLTEQVAAYRNSQTPDGEAYARICAQLRELALEKSAGISTSVHSASPATVSPAATSPAATSPAATVPSSDAAMDISASALAHGNAMGGNAEVLPFCLALKHLTQNDAQALTTEMALLGDVLHKQSAGDTLMIWLHTTASASDLEAVCCFIVDAHQIEITRAAVPGHALVQTPASPAPKTSTPPKTTAPTKSDDADIKPKETSTIRVGVEKVDQIINLVGELVITQAMLVQTATALDPVLHDRLLNGIEHLERNARDLQEAVMSIRMMPMDYVFSRFPRVVRESAARMGKQIKLTTRGQATELDKSLIERIIDPLTHLVRNSIDHGIETPEKRIECGKSPEGNLSLSAQHHGGQIVIEVSDDGAGLDRERILKKAIASGLAVSDSTPDEEVWQLIFAPGFSTAEKVTDISGRGVGMDVVRRNIQAMGGHIQLASRARQGTTTRIVLPLTLAILDGMSVKVGAETFILPLSHVTESMQPSPEQLHKISETEYVLHVRGEYLPLIALHNVFSIENSETEITKAIAVILQAEDMRFALLVDHLIGQHQVVVKNLESNYRKIPGVSAATILGDGSVALIVDVFALMRVTRTRNVTPL